jgi:hypothetical protein
MVGVLRSYLRYVVGSTVVLNMHVTKLGWSGPRFSERSL